MNETGIKRVQKPESSKPWRKCVWKSYRLETGEHQLGENMQGIAIVMVIKGAIRFLTKTGGVPFLLNEYEVCMVSIAPPYKVMIQKETHLLMCMFHLDIFPFDRDMLATLMPFCKKREEHDYLVIKANETIQSFFLLMDNYIQKGLESDLLFDVKRQELFLLLFATYSTTELASFFYPLIGEGLRFKEFVISNHIKAKNVQHLAQIANLSTSGFIKKFVRYFNESPYQWMLRHKAKIILEEICTSPTSLKEIAYKYNFSTYQHFREFCKMQFDVTPSKLRESKKEEKETSDL